jgi:hypothetical protein
VQAISSEEGIIFKAALEPFLTLLGYLPTMAAFL